MWAYTHTLFRAWFSQGHTHAQNIIFDSILGTSSPQPNDKQDGARSVRHIAFDMFAWGLPGSQWPMIGPRPCAYACAYVDPVFTNQSYQINISTSTRRTNLYVFLVLMLMSTHFSLAYVCACAHAYALVKTRLYCDLVKMRYTYWLWAACWASLHKPFRKPFGWCIWDTPPLFQTGILVASQVSWSWHISSLSRCLPLPAQPTGKLYGTIYLNEIKICKSKLRISSDLVTKKQRFLRFWLA